MMVLGYGEDALTLHALTVGLAGILNQLEGKSEPNALIFYRPSFGRSGRSQANFGEFDAIVGTSQAVYLIEAKWALPGTNRGGTLVLSEAQKRRHRVFRAYFEEWRNQPPSDWSSFVERVRPVLARADHAKVPPSSNDWLTENLFYILRRLEGCGSKVVDVLLFCRLDEKTPTPDKCDGFRIVDYVCLTEEGSNFIRLVD